MILKKSHKEDGRTASLHLKLVLFLMTTYLAIFGLQPSVAAFFTSLPDQQKIGANDEDINTTDDVGDDTSGYNITTSYFIDSGNTDNSTSEPDTSRLLQFGRYTAYANIQRAEYGSNDSSLFLPAGRQCRLNHVIAYIASGIDSRPSDLFVNRLETVRARRMSVSNVTTDYPGLPTEYFQAIELSAAGKREAFKLGQNFKKYDLFYQNVQVYASSNIVAQQTKTAFIRGYKGKLRHFTVDDELALNSNSTSLSGESEELLKFLSKNSDLASITEKISQNIDVDVNTEELFALFVGCAYGRANSRQSEINFWCDIFDAETHLTMLKAMDTLTSLEVNAILTKNDTFDASQNKFIQKVKDLINTAKNATNQLPKEKVPGGTLVFGDSLGLLLLLGGLGLAPSQAINTGRDQLTFTDNSSIELLNGSVDTTRLVPFGGNLVIEVQLCDDGDGTPNKIANSEAASDGESNSSTWVNESTSTVAVNTVPDKAIALKNDTFSADASTVLVVAWCNEQLSPLSGNLTADLSSPLLQVAFSQMDSGSTSPLLQAPFKYAGSMLLSLILTGISTICLVHCEGLGLGW